MMLLQADWHNMPIAIRQFFPLPEYLMATRNVVLTDHLEQVVNDLVVSGRYQNASEVLCEGLRLLEQREAQQSAKVDALRKATSLGIMSLEQGQFTKVSTEDLGQFIAELGEQATLTAMDKH
jgi:antitoxin ParD1/3/4